jgi:hypothetical protein
MLYRLTDMSRRPGAVGRPALFRQGGAAANALCVRWTFRGTTWLASVTRFIHNGFRG